MAIGILETKIPLLLGKMLMWSFLKKQKNAKAGMPDDGSIRKSMTFAEIVVGMGDYRELGTHDVALKFWLPEPAEQATDELCGLNGESMSEWLRQFLAIHCYGLYAFTVMKNAMPALFKDASGPLFSREETDDPPGKKRINTYWVPELGNNVAPVKIWIPHRVHNDLKILAAHVGIPLSQYVREIVISRLLGHGMLPGRPEIFVSMPTPAAEDWCDDREIPWQQVDAEQYFAVKIRECRTECVDVPKVIKTG